jgi:hypothetical protein
MPASNSLRSYQDQVSLSARPIAPQCNPKERTGIRKRWPWAMSREDQKLLQQGQVLCEKMMPRGQRPNRQNEEKPQKSAMNRLYQT